MVGKYLPSNEAQHNHENTNVNSLDIRTQTQGIVVIKSTLFLFEKLYMFGILMFLRN